MSAGLSDWDPITVEVVVGAAELLRDAAMAAWAAAGDTVIIDGTTVAEGVAGRGVWRIFGFAAFLTQIGGCPDPARGSLRGNFDATYTWPDNREISQSMGGAGGDGNYSIGPVSGSVNPTVTLDVGTGVGSLVDGVTLSVGITGLDPDMGSFGTVTFYCGDFTQTVDVCSWQNGQNAPWQYGVSVTADGDDMGGFGSYTASAIYNGVTSGTTVYHSSNSNTCAVGIN